jgi:hypothetical protein
MRAKAHAFDPSTSSSTNEGQPHRILGGNHVTNPREEGFDESDSDTWTSHGLKGPLATQIDSNHGMHLEPP